MGSIVLSDVRDKAMFRYLTFEWSNQCIYHSQHATRIYIVHVQQLDMIVIPLRFGSWPLENFSWNPDSSLYLGCSCSVGEWALISDVIILLRWQTSWLWTGGQCIWHNNSISYAYSAPVWLHYVAGATALLAWSDWSISFLCVCVCVCIIFTSHNTGRLECTFMHEWPITTQ